jgi:hypothetical protein
VKCAHTRDTLFRSTLGTSIVFWIAFQWYNLDNLVDDIENFHGQTLINLFTEPLDTNEIISLFPHYTNMNYYSPNKFEYNYKTIHFESGYIKSKEEVLKEIKNLVNEISH